MVKYPQLPAKRNYGKPTGNSFITKDGTSLPMRELILPQDGCKLQVPAYVNRQNYPRELFNCNKSQWIVTVNGVDFYFKDRERSPAVSFMEAVEALYNYYGLPKSVLLSIKASVKKERQRKNIVTGVPGLQISAKGKKLSNGNVSLVYSAKFSTPDRQFTPGIPFDQKNAAELERVLDVLMTYRQKFRSGEVQSVEDRRALFEALKRGVVPVIKHEHRGDLLEQVKANAAMRTAMLKGEGWTNPYTGARIK